MDEDLTLEELLKSACKELVAKETADVDYWHTMAQKYLLGSASREVVENKLAVAMNTLSTKFRDIAIRVPTVECPCTNPDCGQAGHRAICIGEA